jgi:SEL1 protein
LGEWVANFLQDDNPNFDYDALYDDIFDDTITGSDGTPLGGITDDGLAESLIIIGLAAALLVLVWYRAQRVQAQRQDEDARRRRDGGQAAPVAQEERNVFPPPGNPEWNNWAAGGVGH